MLAIALIVLGIITRFIPHTSNFTPVIAIALFSGFYLNKKYAILIPLSLMIVSDLFLGTHNMIIFTWGSVALIAIFGIIMQKRKSALVIAGSSLTCAILFFLITNFGVWLAGWYTHTFAGLINCYTMAIPFFRSTLLSTLSYTAVLFGTYEFIAKRVKNTRFASVLLTR